MKPPDRLRRPPDYLLSVLREGALPFSYRRSRVRALLGAPVAMTGVASSPDKTGLHFEYAASSREHEVHFSGAAAAPSGSPAGLSPQRRAGKAESAATAPSVPPSPRPASEPALAEPDTPPVGVSRSRRETAQAEAPSPKAVIGSPQREAGTSPAAVPDQPHPADVRPVVLRVPSGPEDSASRGPAPPALERRSDAVAAVEPAPRRTVSGSREHPRHADEDRARAEPPLPTSRTAGALTVRAESTPILPPSATPSPDQALREEGGRSPVVLHPTSKPAPARLPARARAAAGADAAEREPVPELRPAPATASLPRLREALPEAPVSETVAPALPVIAGSPPLQPAALPVRRWVPLRRRVPAAYWERRLGHIRARVLR
jgi:hypothetical protein